MNEHRSRIATAASAVVEERVHLEGANRMLEGRFAYPGEGYPRWSALVAGPHPLLGGDLGNNLVGSLVRGFAEAGAAALSFNYGGVGASEGGPRDWPAAMSAFWQRGCFDEEREWVVDAGSALETLRGWCDRPLVAVGYSFGCWTLCEALPQGAAQAIVLISPNPKHHAFDSLNGLTAPLFVLHSDNDFTCSVDEITAWFSKLREPKSLVILDSAEHFFRTQEHQVVETVLAFLVERGVEAAAMS